MSLILVLSCVTFAAVDADVSMCVKPDGTKAPCGPGNQECSQFGFDASSPQFHVRDNSCGENDPNGPVYDPVHGVYHLHYQDHVGLTRPDGTGGRTWGHAVSRDFAHWAHMPISIWNDRPYDSNAIFTGSATVVDGKVIQVYPGLCDKEKKDCPGATNLCIAVPSDPSDPLQTNWTKEEWTKNPVIAQIGRDPSTAWQTPDKEWRLTTFDTVVYGSMDFKTWYRIGEHPGFVHGECPSFFELPRTTPGAGPAPVGAQTPTHVFKACHHRKDFMKVGTYTPGKPRELGNFTATPGVPHEDAIVDAGALYASKDFYDPVKKRRINWGWATNAGVQTLPREITWHPELQQLVYQPVDEQEKLRNGIIGSLKRQALPIGSEVSLGLPAQIGKQSEVLASFQKPTTAQRLAVRVMADFEGKAGSYNGTQFFVDYVPAVHGEAVTKLMVGIVGGANDTLQMLAADKTIDVRVFVDHTIAEVYWMDGRVAMTAKVRATNAADVTVVAEGRGATLVSATAWKVESIWVTPEDVLKTPRLDTTVVV